MFESLLSIRSGLHPEVEWLDRGVIPFMSRLVRKNKPDENQCLAHILRTWQNQDLTRLM